MKEMPEAIFPTIDLLYQNKELYRTDALAEEFGIGETESTDETYPAPHRISNFCQILVTAGNIEIEIDNKRYIAGEGALFSIIPMHILHTIHRSSDFRARICVVSIKMLGSIVGEFSPLQYFHLKKFPLLQLEPKDMGTILGLLGQLTEKCNDKDNIFRREIVVGLFSVMLCEIGNIARKILGPQEEIRSSSRKEDIFRRFIGLLSEHCKTEHTVEFYAKRLCLTPQHLCSVLKEVSGKSTSQMIDSSLTVEAKILLKTSPRPIQEIATVLNFPDQSTFGKFFKKNTGMSPSQYRANNKEV